MLLDNEIKTTHNKLAVLANPNKKVFMTKSPNWSARYLIKFFRTDGVLSTINDNEVFTLDLFDITVYDDNNSACAIPSICQQELNRDVTHWMREASHSKLKDYLPSLASNNRQEIAGKVIKIDCFYQALTQYTNGDTNYIRCHPNFFKRGPRYDFVLQNHGEDNMMQDKFGKTTHDVTPSQLLVL